MEKTDRMKILIRFLFTLLFMLIQEILRGIIQIMVVFQYIYLLITREPNEPVRRFMNRVAIYQYSVTRYISVLSNAKPFPLGELAVPYEKEEDTVEFN